MRAFSTDRAANQEFGAYSFAALMAMAMSAHPELTSIGDPKFFIVSQMTLFHSPTLCDRLAAACAVAFLAVGAGPVAGTNGATCVVELFTSQGCSSCPPADRLLSTMARDPSIVALSFPIDYWDYIGWKDTLASPSFTQRQKAYAATRGDDHVYTPQAVVDGVVDVVGSDNAEMDRAIKSAKGRESAMTVPMHLTQAGNRLHIAIGAGPSSGSPAGVYVLRVAKTRTVEIHRGENSGRSVTYTNVVRAMTKIGEWQGNVATFDMPELKGDDEGYVVLLQQGTPTEPGAILAAAKSAEL
jgi:hypothetical protein